MKPGLVFLFAAALLLTTAPLYAAGITGQYVEARTCDVYTGACFANADTGPQADASTCNRADERRNPASRSPAAATRGAAKFEPRSVAGDRRVDWRGGNYCRGDVYTAAPRDARGPEQICVSGE